MEKDKTKWNQRYKTGNYPQNPSEFLSEFIHLAPKGHALDIASGNGRNAAFIAENGFTVDAVDISDVGLTETQTKNSTINTIEADLDTFQIPFQKYDLISNINFLERRLFPGIIDGLKPGGVLLFRTFLDDKRFLGENCPPKSSHYLLKNELLLAFLSLEVRYYQEKETRLINGDIAYCAELAAIKTNRT